MNALDESSRRGMKRRRFSLWPSLAIGGFWLPVLLAFLNPCEVQGVPYASGLTNQSGTIFFRLNEAADNVLVISEGGARTNALGPMEAGLNRYELGNAGTFQVVVAKSGPPGFLTPVEPHRGAVLQVNSNTAATRFFSPRGLAINNNPASPFFGRIYVANATSGTVSNTLFGPERSMGDGIYALHSDFTDALGQGDEALTGGLDFAAGLDLAPYRLTIGQDDNLYVCNLSDTNGSLYVVHPDVSPDSGTNVLGGPAGGQFPLGFFQLHGSISAAVVEGSLATSNLVAFVIDEDLQTDRASTDRYMQNSLWRHDLYDTIPGVPWQPPSLTIAAPWVGFASQTMDLSRGSNGYFYVNTYRSPGNDWAGLYVHDDLGVCLWDSLSGTRLYLNDGSAADLLQSTGGGAVSPEGGYAAVINLDTSAITIVPLIDGIPDLANHLVIGWDSRSSSLQAVAQGRDVAWDLAGNLYAISAGAQAVRAFSPGGTTTAITGSDGTFRLIRPPTVSVTAPDSFSFENGERGSFSITRAGDMIGELTVSFTVTGSAEQGVDYLLDLHSATIAAGATSVEILVPAIDDTLSEPAETVTLSIVSSPDYVLRTPSSATITVVDDDPAMINIVTEDAKAFERLPDDTLSFRIERLGQTNSELSIRYSTSTGTALQDLDYIILNHSPGSNQIQLLPGQVSERLIIQPLDDREAEGEESVVITLLDGGDEYSPGTLNSAVGFVTDDDQLTNGTLFFDDLDSDTSTNWTMRFGANNGIFDAEVRWAFDYGSIGIPPAPNSASGSTLGLFVQVNKTNATAGGSAAINLYPTGRTFAGNYALRFDLFLAIGTASTTEHALLGLNHSAQLTNRVTQSTDINDTTRGGDGVFVAVAADGSNNRDWTAYTVPNIDDFPVAITNRTAASLVNILTDPPYTIAGSPGVGPYEPKVWTEMELSQSNGVVTLKANNQLIYSFTNTSGFTSGDIMLGHSDQFDSIGSGGLTGNFAIFDNVRVLSLDLPIITSVELLPSNTVQIDFLSTFGGPPADYLLQSASDPSELVWNDESTAVITATGAPNSYRSIVTGEGDSRFYRIQLKISEHSAGPR